MKNHSRTHTHTHRPIFDCIEIWCYYLIAVLKTINSFFSVRRREKKIYYKTKKTNQHSHLYCGRCAFSLNYLKDRLILMKWNEMKRMIDSIAMNIGNYLIQTLWKMLRPSRTVLKIFCIHRFLLDFFFSEEIERHFFSPLIMSCCLEQYAIKCLFTAVLWVLTNHFGILKHQKYYNFDGISFENDSDILRSTQFVHGLAMNQFEQKRKYA